MGVSERKKVKIEFTIYGEPVAKGRPRVTKKGITYTPEKTKTAEQSFQAQAWQHRPCKQIEGALSLRVIFYRSLPKSISKKKSGMALAGWILPTTRPDLDNCLKLVKDAMNGIFYHDDSQICKVVTEKYYSNNPRIEVGMDVIDPGATEGN